MRYIPIFSAAIVAAAMTVASTVAQGQSVLKGVPGVRLLIEDFSDAAPRCGIKKDEIQSAAMYPLSGSALTIADKNQFGIPVFYIQIVTVGPMAQGMCSSAVRVEAFTSQNLKVDYANVVGHFQVTLWQNIYVVATATFQHGQTVRETVERLTKDFVTAWNLDNKK